MLLTRSPLSTRASPGFSFDLHVLGAPPAFVLSQDQTLHRDFNLAGEPARHEIGEPPGSEPLSSFRLACTAAPEGVSPCGIDGDVSRDTPALAFGVNYSVFKEPLLDRGPGATGTVVAASVEPTLTSRLGRPAMTLQTWRRAGERRPCQSAWSPRADWRSYEPNGASASRQARISGVFRPPGGSTPRCARTFPIQRVFVHSR